MKDVISTPRSPKAFGPYSQRIRANGFIFISGQLPIDRASGQLAEGDIALQAEIVLENLRAIVVAAGSNLAKVVKATIYLKNMNDCAKVNEIYGKYFSFDPPTRSTVEVTGIPKEASLEIDLIAFA